MFNNQNSSSLIFLIISFVFWSVISLIISVLLYILILPLNIFAIKPSLMLVLAETVEVFNRNVSLMNLGAATVNIAELAIKDASFVALYLLLLFVGYLFICFLAFLGAEKKVRNAFKQVSMLKLKERYLNKKLNQEHQLKEVSINRILDNSTDCYLRLTDDYRVLHVNSSAKSFFNRVASISHYKNIFLTDIIPDIKSTNFTHMVSSVLQTQVSKTAEIYLSHYKKWLLVRIYFEDSALGVYFSDITAKKEAAVGIESGVSLLKQLLDASIESVALVDLNWKYLLTNQKWIRSFGLEEKKVQGNLVLDTIPTFVKEIEEYQRELVRGEAVKLKEFKTMILGKEEWIRFEINPFRNEDDKITGFIISAIFTTQVRQRRKQAEKQRETERQLAYHDMLTGLPNRQLFHDRLNEALTNSYRNLKKAALLFVDLDGFKAVNDTLGHDVGDRLLQDVAQRLTNAVRASDTVSRLGGDEFTVILTDIDNVQDVANVASKLINVIGEPYDYGEGIVARVTGSIGVSMYPKDGSSSVDLIKHADESMYKAKNSGKNNFVFYEATSFEVDSSQFTVDTIQSALSSNEFILHYQGCFDHDKNKVYGVEGLLRWNHPQYGLLRAAQFLPAIEQEDIMVDLGQFVLQKACQQLKNWEEQGQKGLLLTINLSPREIKDKTLVKRLERLVSQYDIKPNSLGVEISEKVILNNSDTVIKTLKQLKALGIVLIVENLDQAGLSINTLKDVNIDMLKIDYKYIEKIGKDTESENAVVNFIKMAKSIGVEPAADCVETSEQEAFLIKNGCVKMQGFLFGRPSKPTKHFVITQK